MTIKKMTASFSTLHFSFKLKIQDIQKKQNFKTRSVDNEQLTDKQNLHTKIYIYTYCISESIMVAQTTSEVLLEGFQQLHLLALNNGVLALFFFYIVASLGQLMGTEPAASCAP